MDINKTLDLKDLQNPKADGMVAWFEHQYKELDEANIRYVKNAYYRPKLRYWEYYWTTLNTSLRKGSRILDVGCGGTLFPFWLEAFYVAEVIGIDKSKRLVGLSNKQAFHFENEMMIQYYTADICDGKKFIKWEESFDAIFLISVIEHIKDDIGALSNCVEMLKPGGLLTLTFDYHKHKRRSFRLRKPISFGRIYNMERVNLIVSVLKQWGVELVGNSFIDGADYADLPHPAGYTMGSLFFQKKSR